MGNWKFNWHVVSNPKFELNENCAKGNHAWINGEAIGIARRVCDVCLLAEETRTYRHLIPRIKSKEYSNALYSQPSAYKS